MQQLSLGGRRPATKSTGVGLSSRGVALAAAALVCLFALSVAAAPAGAETSTFTYAATETVPVPPASHFAGSGGEQQVATADQQQVDVNDQLEVARVPGRLGGQRLREGSGHDMDFPPGLPSCFPGPRGSVRRCGLTVPPRGVTYSRPAVDHHVRNQGRPVEYPLVEAPGLWTSRASQPAHAWATRCGQPMDGCG